MSEVILMIIYEREKAKNMSTGPGVLSIRKKKKALKCSTDASSKIKRHIEDLFSGI